MRPVGDHSHAVRVWQAGPEHGDLLRPVRLTPHRVGVHHDLRVEPLRVRGAAVGEVDVVGGLVDVQPQPVKHNNIFWFPPMLQSSMARIHKSLSLRP